MGDNKTGKSSVSKVLASKLDLSYIEIEELLEECLKRVVDYENKDDELDENGNVVNVLVDNVDLNIIG